MIKGLTDRGGRLPSIGELRKGAQKQGNSIGKDLEHFRFTSKDPLVVETFHQHFGDEPKEVSVMFAYATTGENFQSWREEWRAGGLVHRCDGESCVAWQRDNGSYSSEPRACPGGCKPVGRLYVVIPQLARLALVTVLTTSIHDIINIHGSLLALEELRGDLRGIPFDLSRRPREISMPGQNGQRVRRQKHLLHIEVSARFVIHQLVAMEQKALPAASIDQEDTNGVDEIGDVEITREGEVISLPPSVQVHQVEAVASGREMDSQSEEANSITQEQFTKIGEMSEALIKADVWTSRADASTFLSKFAGVKSRHGLSEAKAVSVIEELKRRWPSVFEEEAKPLITAEDIPF